MQSQWSTLNTVTAEDVWRNGSPLSINATWISITALKLPESDKSNRCRSEPPHNVHTAWEKVSQTSMLRSTQLLNSAIKAEFHQQNFNWGVKNFTVFFMIYTVILSEGSYGVGCFNFLEISTLYQRVMFDVSLSDWQRQVAQCLSGFKGDCVVKEASIKPYLVTSSDTCATADSLRRPSRSKAQTVFSKGFLRPLECARKYNTSTVMIAPFFRLWVI